MRGSLQPNSAGAPAVESPEPVALTFDAFFRAHHARLFAALCLTTGNRHEAEEIAQEAFVRMLEHWDRVAGLDEPAAYLFTTAMNLFRRRYRRAKLAAKLPLPVPGQTPDDAYATVDDRDALVRALRDLTPQQRAAIVLTTMLDFPSEKAGRILGIKDSTVRVLAGRAREQLRSNVGETR